MRNAWRPVKQPEQDTLPGQRLCQFCKPVHGASHLKTAAPTTSRGQPRGLLK